MFMIDNEMLIKIIEMAYKVTIGELEIALQEEFHQELKSKILNKIYKGLAEMLGGEKMSLGEYPILNNVDTTNKKNNK